MERATMQLYGTESYPPIPSPSGIIPDTNSEDRMEIDGKIAKIFSSVSNGVSMHGRPAM